MNQVVTEGIILSRTNYGEADRILTLLTPEHGKLRLLAKGVRRVRSKLAGGIELFSVSTITFVRGRGELGTLVSTRLVKHYRHIVEDLDRTMLGYELIKRLNKNTEDHPEAAYFDLLQQVFEALDDPEVSIPIIRFWFAAQLLRIGGHTPNLQSDTTGQKLSTGQTYSFDFESTSLRARDGGDLGANHIKFLRLSFGETPVRLLAHVQGSARLIDSLSPIMATLAQNSLAHW